MGHTADCRPLVTAADGRYGRANHGEPGLRIRDTAAASRLLPPGDAPPGTPTRRATPPRGREASPQRARDPGYEHPHAIRILARAGCRVIWTRWQQRTPYDPTRHRAARPFTLRLVDQKAA